MKYLKVLIELAKIAGMILVVAAGIFLIALEVYTIRYQISERNEGPVVVGQVPEDPKKYGAVFYIPDDPMRGQLLATQAFSDCAKAEKDPQVKSCLIQEEGAHYWLFSRLIIGAGTHNVMFAGTTTGTGTLWEGAWENNDGYPFINKN